MMTGTATLNSGNLTIGFEVDGNEANVTLLTTGVGNTFYLRGHVFCRTTGAAGTIGHGYLINVSNQEADSANVTSSVIDTTGTVIIKVTAQFSASDAGHDVTAHHYHIRKIATP